MALGALISSAVLGVSLGLFAPPSEGWHEGGGGEANPEQADGGEYDAPQAELGPFFQAEPPSEVTYPSAPKKTTPALSVGEGVFCFVEDSTCKASLIADADIGAGLNIVGSERGLDVPLTQFRFRGGMTIRPLMMRKRAWHPWGLGLTVNWSQASPQVRASTAESLELIRELGRMRSIRIAMVHQLWLARKRNAVHLDFTFGGINTQVLDAPGTFWGTTAEVAVGWAGWGGLYGSVDFLDRDTRMIFGFRTHAIAAGPVIAAVLIGLLAGGAL